MARIPIRELHSEAVLQSTRPAPTFEGSGWDARINSDYVSEDKGVFRVVEAARCDNCNKIATSSSCEHCGADVYGLDGPMMNYWYPTGTKEGRYSFALNGLDEDEAAKKLVDLPLCLVVVDGDYGLALTGGGMDLTWSIVEAFTTLGFLPPLDHCVPPRFAGMKLGTNQRYLLGACRASARWAIRHARYKLGEIDQVRDWLKANND